MDNLRKQHSCYLNWNLSSRGMEPDLMVEAFEMGLSLYGMIYRKVTGDGDSSVMAH